MSTTKYNLSTNVELRLTLEFFKNMNIFILCVFPILVSSAVVENPLHPSGTSEDANEIENDADVSGDIQKDDTSGSDSLEEFSDENETDVGTSRAYMTGARLWPGGKVYYDVDMSIYEQNLRDKIHIGMKAISDSTCVEFIQRNNQNSMKPFLSFFRLNAQNKNGCSSPVGFQNRFPQRITLTPKNCDNHEDNYAGSAIHEAMHSLGFLHEFQRYDRDNYIRYIGKETGQRYEVNYGINKDSETGGVPFNYKSIMQYDSNVGFQEVPRKPNVQAPLGVFANMGQECKISAGDRNLINNIYASECGLQQPVHQFKDDHMIPGTNCNMKIQPMNDEGTYYYLKNVGTGQYAVADNDGITDMTQWLCATGFTVQESHL